MLFACLAWVEAQARELPDFTRLAARQGAAVVNISSLQNIRSPHGAVPELDQNDPMFDWLRRFVPRHQQQEPPQEEPDNRSLGSGFIVSQDGYILTNAHVIEAADDILVRLADKREFRARLVGADKRTDVALLKIESSRLPHVTLGDPGKLRVGEWVMAIGSPFGFEQSVTAGIVSAKGRSLPQENFVPFIQTDVAINPGNSGGPLFNLKGEVVGINSQIYSRTGGFMGLSFSIPIDVAMDVQNQLRASGKVRRGRIGVVIQEVSKDLSEGFGLAKPQGALVSSVEQGGPAEKAGVEQGDIILRFEGRPVLMSSDLPRIVGSTRPGARAHMLVWRRGAGRELQVTVAELPEEAPRRVAFQNVRPERGENRLGLTVAEPAAEQRRDPRLASGLLVRAVRSGAALAEIRSGDVLVAFVFRGNRTDVRSVEQFNRIVGAMRAGQTATLLIRRGDTHSFVSVTAGER
ncbi:MAG: Do family serine endopeptidase [Zoogloea sp.]|nr:Do family serine endopeptidase [Zoogloea sp.]